MTKDVTSIILDVNKNGGGKLMPFKIKEMRKNKGMSQEELSKQAGISRQIISDLESGDKEVNTTTNTLLRIAEALGCTISDIFCP